MLFIYILKNIYLIYLFTRFYIAVFIPLSPSPSFSLFARMRWLRISRTRVGKSKDDSKKYLSSTTQHYSTPSFHPCPDAMTMAIGQPQGPIPGGLTSSLGSLQAPYAQRGVRAQGWCPTGRRSWCFAGAVHCSGGAASCEGSARSRCHDQTEDSEVFIVDIFVEILQKQREM